MAMSRSQPSWYRQVHTYSNESMSRLQPVLLAHMEALTSRGFVEIVAIRIDGEGARAI
jgi:hypothetical protein